MNVDAMITTHHSKWERLDKLARQRTLSAEEAEELLDLYRQVGAHTSYIATHNPDPTTLSALSGRVLQARRRLTGSYEPAGAELRHFFAVALPVALWRLRWLSLAVAIGFLSLSTFAGWWVASHPEVLSALVSEEDARRLVNEDFEAYYSQGTPGGFFGRVWVNNSWIAAVNIGAGFTGYLPLMSMYYNAMSVGVTGGIMWAYGGGSTFFSLITPHGLLELTSIFVAGAAGLRLFWAWVSAGTKPRLQTLAVEGRALITVAIGLTISLCVSAVIEAYVTPSDLSTDMKITIGTIALLAFFAYPIFLGRTGELRGEEGDMSATQRGSVTLTSG